MLYIKKNSTLPSDPDWDNIVSEALFNGYTLPTKEAPYIRLIQGLKDLGIWSNLDAFYVFAGDGDADFKCINWVDPTNFEATQVNSPIFSSSGVAGNGTNAYLDTNLNPTTIGLKASQNDAMIISVISGIGSGLKGGTVSGLIGGNFEDTLRSTRNFRRMNGQFSDDTTSNITGLFAIARTSSSAGWFSQKEVEQTLTSTSNYFMNYNRSILRATNDYGNCKVSCWGTGASVSQTTMQAFRTTYNYFLYRIGQPQIA